MRVMSIVCAALLVPWGALGADTVEVTASVDRERISPDDTLVLTVEIKGVRGASTPKLPALDEWQLLSGPSYSTHFQMVNGQTNVSTRYEYALSPRKTGKLTIGAVTVTHGGRSYRTTPISVQVRGGGSGGRRVAVRGGGSDKKEEGNAQVGKKMFAEISVDKDVVYLHEQVIFTFRFYYSGVRLAGQTMYDPPPATGFVQRPLGEGKSRNYTRVLNGRRYNVVEITGALFPYRTGELSVGPAKLKGAILVASRNRQRTRRSLFDDFFNDPFFGNYQQQPIEISSNTVSISAQSLPEEGAPGGDVSVGKYSLGVDIQPDRVQVGDPVTVTMRVQGEGDLETIAPPVFRTLDGFKSYDPTSSTEYGNSIDRITGVKVFEQAVVPLREDITRVPAVHFSFFNPYQERYVTLSRGPFPLQVMPADEDGGAKLVSVPGGDGRRGVELIERNIVFIKTSPGTITRKPAKEGGWIFWFIQAIPLVAVGVAMWHSRHRRRLHSDRGYARLRGAGRKTRKRLALAEKALARGDVEEFYGNCAKAISRYIADRCNMPGSGLTPEGVCRILRERGVSEEEIRSVMSFYEKCDLARFASAGMGKDEMKQSYRDAREILAELKSLR